VKKSQKRLLCLTNDEIQIYDLSSGGSSSASSCEKLKWNTQIGGVQHWDAKIRNAMNGQKCEISLHYVSDDSSSKKKKETFSCWLAPELLTVLSARRDLLKAGVQLSSGSSFFVRKWTKANEYVEYTLKFYGARIYKFDNTCNQPLGFIDMKQIDSVAVVREKPDVFVIFIKGRYTVQYYSTNDVKGVIGAIQDQLKKLLGWDQLIVQEKSLQEILDFRNFQKALVDAQSDQFPREHNVERIKVRLYDQAVVQRTRKLKMNSKYLVEVNEQNQIASIHRISDIVSLIRLHTDRNQFSIEYTADHTYTYSSIERDSILLNILEMRKKPFRNSPLVSKQVSSGDLKKKGNSSVQQQESASGGDDSIRTTYSVPQLLNFVQLENTRQGYREGIKSFPPHQEYTDHIIKKIAAGVEKCGSLANYVQVLKEFNQSYHFGDLSSIKEKKPLHNLFEALKIIEQKDSKKMIEVQLKRDYQQIVMIAIAKVISSKTVFEEISSYRQQIVELVVGSGILQPTSPGVRFYASSLLIQMLNTDLSAPYAEKHMQFIMSQEIVNKLLVILRNFHTDMDNCMMIHNVLFLLQLLLHAGSANIELANHLITRLQEEEMRSILYRLCRNEALPIALISTQLLNVMLSRASNQQFSVLQNEILSCGLLVHQIYEALFSVDADQKHASVMFVDLSVSFSQDAELLMTKIVPTPLVALVDAQVRERKDVKLKQSKVNFFGKHVAQKETYEYQSRGWGKVLDKMKADFANAVCIWNAQTREDLRESLRAQIAALDEAKKQYAATERFVWNYKEYETNFKSLAPYDKVNEYFLFYLQDPEQVSVTSFENAELLIKELYYKMLLTEDDALRKQFARATTRVYLKTMAKNNRSFPHLDNLVQVIASETYPQDVIMDMIELLNALMSVRINQHLVNQHCVPMLVQFVRKIHCSTSHDLRVAKICVHILHHLCAFRIRGVQPNQIMRPLPIAIRVMTDFEYFPHLVQSLLSAPHKLKRKTLGLIIQLLTLNEKIVPSLYQTGLYYFIFASMSSQKEALEVSPTSPSQDAQSQHSDEVPEISSEQLCLSLEAVKILQMTCASQSFIHEDFGLRSNQNILHALLPSALVNYLLTVSPEEFQKTFNSNAGSESLIWDNEMRKFLKQSASDHISEFVAELRAKKGDVLYHHTPLQKMVYVELENQPYVAGYYLRNLSAAFISTLTETELSHLFWSVVEAFKVAPEDSQLVFYVKAQTTILKRFDVVINERTYSAFTKCASVMSVIDIKQWDLQLTELTAQLVDKLTVNQNNLDECITLQYPEILVRLLSKTFEFRDFHDQHDAEAAAMLSMCDFITARIYNILSRMISYPSMQELIETDSEFPSLMMRCFHTINNKDVLKSLDRLIIVLCSNRFSGFIQKLWYYGFPILMIHLMLYRPHKNTPEQIKNMSISKAGAAAHPLAAVVGASSELVDLELTGNFYINDLMRMLPREIVLLLQHLGTHPNAKVKSLMETLHKETEDPGMVWTVSMRKQLHAYVSKCVSIMEETKFTNNRVATDSIKYEDLKDYLHLGYVFVDIYIDNKWDHWQPRDSKFFAGELLGYISDIPSHNTDDSHLAVDACLTLLRRTQQQNMGMFKDLVTHTFGAPRGIEILFNNLKLNNEQLDAEAYTNLINSIALCFDSDAFVSRLGSECVDYFHNFVCALDYAVKHCAPLIGIILLLLREHCASNAALADAMEKNGVLLYILLFFSGYFSNSSDDDRKEATKILNILAKRKPFAHSEDDNAPAENISMGTLKALLPHPIIDHILEQTATNTLTFLESKHDAPNIVWNTDTKKEFKTYLAAQIDFVKSNKHWSLPEHFKLTYTTKERLMIGDIYVRLYNQQPDYPLANSEHFLFALCKALKIAKDDAICLDLLLAIRNVIDHSVANKTILAHHPCVNSCATLLFNFVGDVQSHPIIASVSLQLIYQILHHGNTKFLPSVESSDAMRSLIQRMEDLPDLQELFLVVFLMIARQGDCFVKDLLDNHVDSQCVELMEQRKGTTKAQRAAQLLKFIVTESSYGHTLEEKLTTDHGEIWEEYKEIQVPPPNMPLAESLLTSSEPPPQKQLELHGRRKRDSLSSPVSAKSTYNDPQTE